MLSCLSFLLFKMKYFFFYKYICHIFRHLVLSKELSTDLFHPSLAFLIPSSSCSFLFTFLNGFSLLPIVHQERPPSICLLYLCYCLIISPKAILNNKVLYCTFQIWCNADYFLLLRICFQHFSCDHIVIRQLPIQQTHLSNWAHMLVITFVY